jgi:hypothetical protein
MPGHCPRGQQNPQERGSPHLAHKPERTPDRLKKTKQNKTKQTHKNKA